jgi:hypothetical protein
MLRTWASRLVLAGILTQAAAHPTQAASSFYTGSELLERCESKSPYLLGVCFGFIVGVGSGFDCEQLLLGRFAFQAPDGATAGQIKKIVVKYLNEHPENLHLPAAPLAAAALSKAFPCP